nr:hypothetical protein [Tanacetum cinerariifolium]
MEQLTSMCDMVGQYIQKKQEEIRIKEEQAAKARYWKIPICYDDDDDEDYTIAITPILSTEYGDEHLNTIPTTESDESIKSCVENLFQNPNEFNKSSVENLVPNPSESEGENGCDVPSCFTTFSNILFDDEYEFDSADDQLLHNEDFS